MHSLLLLATLASAPASLDEPTPALQARVLREVDRPQAVADLFRLFERRDETGDLSSLLETLQAAARSPRARAAVRAVAVENRGERSPVRARRPEAATPAAA